MKSYPFAKLTVTGFPNTADIHNKWIFTPDVKVVINVSCHDYPKEISSALNSRSRGEGDASLFLRQQPQPNRRRGFLLCKDR